MKKKKKSSEEEKEEKKGKNWAGASTEVTSAVIYNQLFLLPIFVALALIAKMAEGEIIGNANSHQRIDSYNENGSIENGDIDDDRDFQDPKDYDDDVSDSGEFWRFLTCLKPAYCPIHVAMVIYVVLLIALIRTPRRCSKHQAKRVRWPGEHCGG